MGFMGLIWVRRAAVFALENEVAIVLVLRAGSAHFLNLKRPAYRRAHVVWPRKDPIGFILPFVHQELRQAKRAAGLQGVLTRG